MTPKEICKGVKHDLNRKILCKENERTIAFDFFEKERFDASEFIVLIPLPTRSMLLMIPAHDLIAMYLAIELQSLCFYVIAASKRTLFIFTAILVR
ncbi:hypothetical protein ZWY2020_000067 [Hordeum vulgare]|nr:hypothetical protein ZWY2020_000067 [Hordeum vulgare]